MVRKCEIGVRTTRSRSALATAVQTAAPPAKRRILRELAQSTPKSTRTRTKTTPFVVEELGDDRTGVAEARTSPSSDDREAQVSCCSSNDHGSSEIADDDNDDQDQDQLTVDLKDDEGSEVETSTREMTPSRKLRGESDNGESTSKPTVVNCNRRSSSSSMVTKLAVKMPSESELEDFFAAAEKDIQKRFAEKYNFDIVKDTPLQGRYEWVRLNITKNS